MRILRTYLKIPPCKGGMENHIYELSLEQRNLNHEVYIAFNEGERTSDNDIQVLRGFKLYSKLRLIFAIPIFYILLVIRILTKPVKFDVIHIHGDWHSFLFASILKNITNSQRVIFSIHGDISEYSNFILKLLFKQVQKADVVFVTGYQSYLSIKQQCSAVFQPSGVNDYFYVQKEMSRNKAFTIITVSRLAPKKNIKTILKVAKELPQFLFQILGSGEELDELKSIIFCENLSNVELLGTISKQQIPLYLQRADMFIFTSIWEGTPTSVLEALACGLPIVSSNAGGLSRIIKNGVNGYVVNNPMDVNSFVERILMLEENESLRQVMIENNKRLSLRFRWDIVAKDITKKTLNECD